MYSLSFAPKTDWSKRYAEAPEIFSYIQDLVSDYNLRAFARLNTEVLGVHYQQDRCLWQIHLQDQSILEAQFVVFASGPLHVPQIPHITGIEKFKVKSFILLIGIIVMILKGKMSHRLGQVAVQFNIPLKLHPNANSSMYCSLGHSTG